MTRLERYQERLNIISQMVEKDGIISNTAGKVLEAIGGHFDYDFSNGDDLEDAMALLNEISDILINDVGAYI